MSLPGEAPQNPVGYLWNARGWDAVECNKLNDKVADPAFNSAVRAFHLGGPGALAMLLYPGNCFFDRLGVSFLGSVAPQLESMKVMTERRNSVPQLLKFAFPVAKCVLDFTRRGCLQTQPHP